MRKSKISKDISKVKPVLAKKQEVFIAPLISQKPTSNLKEFTLFKSSKYPVSFNLVQLAQGLIVLALFIAAGVFLIPQHNQTPSSLAIKSATVKQSSTIVANGDPVKWTAFVKKSDIKNNQYLLNLPKQATNIKVTSISANQAKDILNAKPQEQLSLGQRQQLANENKHNSFFIASIFNILSRYFTSSIEDGVETLTDVFTEQVETTEEAVVVDLSTEVPAVEEIIGTSDVPMTEEVPAVEETPVPVEEAPVVETPVPAVIPAPDATRGQAPAGIQSDGSDTNTNLDSPIQGNDNGQQGNDNSQNDSVVQVSYETPAPTITEQETDTGKLVTVSDANSKAFDCETLNPNKKEVPLSDILGNTAAGLLNGFSNFFNSISKFLFADLEEAVSNVIDVVVPPAEPAPVDNDKQVKQAGKEQKQPASVENSGVAKEEKQEKKNEEAPVEEVQISSDSVESEPSEPAVDIGTSDVPLTPVEPVVEPTPVEPMPTPGVDDSQYQACLANQVKLTDVLAFTNIPEIYKVGEEDKIKIKWKNNNNQNVEFQAYDKDNNGKLDYVEWTVPHLSDQIFEIIFISKAFQLDENQDIVADIYDTVKTQDQNYSTVPEGQYIRVTFNSVLDNTRDITMYMRPTPGSAFAKVEVYPVYADAEGNQTQGPMLETVNDGTNPDFSNVDHDGKYRVLLTNLETPTAVFDLKILPGY